MDINSQIIKTDSGSRVINLDSTGRPKTDTKNTRPDFQKLFFVNEAWIKKLESREKNWNLKLIEAEKTHDLKNVQLYADLLKECVRDLKLARAESGDLKKREIQFYTDLIPENQKLINDFQSKIDSLKKENESAAKFLSAAGKLKN